MYTYRFIILADFNDRKFFQVLLAKYDIALKYWDIILHSITFSYFYIRAMIDKFVRIRVNKNTVIKTDSSELLRE
jgi:hypothetical protein